MTEWTIKTFKEGRRWAALATRGKEGVWGQGKTQAEAEAHVRLRLRDGGYAE